MDTVGDAYIVAALIPTDADANADSFACAAILRLAGTLLQAVAAAPHDTGEEVIEHSIDGLGLHDVVNRCLEIIA